MRKSFREGVSLNMTGRIVVVPHIQCVPPNLLVAFMWRKPLNSAALAAAIHKGFRKVSNMISTQVVD